MLFTALSYAQVGINTNTPNASSALEIESTTGGILIPRMKETQRDAIVSPASGLMIYQTDEILGFYFYNGTAWTKIDGVAGPQGDQGPAGTQGIQGAPGAQGPAGPTGNTGPVGAAGTDGNDGANGSNGSEGSSAYQIWLAAGNSGSQADFLASLVGPEGPLVSGINGQTLYSNGNKWVSTSNLFNDGSSVSIGTDNIDPSAIFQIESTTQGVLFPKMTSEQRDLIAIPQAGLLIFQIDNSPGFYFYDGTAWVALNTSNGTSSGGSDSKTLIYTTNGF